MNLKGLQGFAQVMAAGTLAAAAKNMNISESALSRQIMILESVLGVTLFDRTKRNLAPTLEGEAFYYEAEKILMSIDEIPRIVQAIKKGVRERVRVIVMPRMAPRVAVPSIVEALAEKPDFEITVEVHRRTFIERWVAARHFDIGIGALPSFHANIDTEFLCSLPTVILMAHSHPMANRSSVRLEELANEDFISSPAGSLLGKESATHFENAGIVTRSRIEVSQSAMVCDLVAQGIGVAIHDPLIPESMRPNLAMVPLENVAKMRLGLFFPNDVVRSSATNYLADVLRRHAKSLQTQIDQDLGI